MFGRKRAKKVAVLPADPYESARLAGLRYVTDKQPGITRRRAGKGFLYVDAAGKSVRDNDTLRRIRSLVIPPAWRNVWICPSSEGHLQAVGTDARGRKQYRYHAVYRLVRDTTKYTRLYAFGTALPKIRARVELDMRRPGIPREKVLATVVHLLEETCIRIGNDEYKKANESFGLTTLQDEHVEIDGSTIRFRFKGKSAQWHEVEVTNRRLAKIVLACQEIPGDELFQYIDAEGQVRDVTSGDVNEYLYEVTGERFTAKDFRTWNGTCQAALALRALGPAETQTACRKCLVEAVKQTARRLNNRPATCKKYYIHPAIMEAYTDGSLFDVMRQAESAAPADYRPEEVAVMTLLEKYKPQTPASVEAELPKKLAESLRAATA